jgi:hypothetical protein
MYVCKDFYLNIAAICRGCCCVFGGFIMRLIMQRVIHVRLTMISYLHYDQIMGSIVDRLAHIIVSFSLVSNKTLKKVRMHSM